MESRVKEGTTFRVWFPLHERYPRLLGAGEGGGAASTNGGESQ